MCVMVLSFLSSFICVLFLWSLVLCFPPGFSPNLLSLHTCTASPSLSPPHNIRLVNRVIGDGHLWKACQHFEKRKIHLQTIAVFFYSHFFFWIIVEHGKNESMLALSLLDMLRADNVNWNAEDCRQKRPTDDVLSGIMATQGTGMHNNKIRGMWQRLDLNTNQTNEMMRCRWNEMEKHRWW